MIPRIILQDCQVIREKLPVIIWINFNVVILIINTLGIKLSCSQDQDSSCPSSTMRFSLTNILLIWPTELVMQTVTPWW